MDASSSSVVDDGDHKAEAESLNLIAMDASSSSVVVDDGDHKAERAPIFIIKSLNLIAMDDSSSSVVVDDGDHKAEAEVGVANDVVPVVDAELVFDAAAIETRTWLLDFINNAGDSLPDIAKMLITQLHENYHKKLGFPWKKLYCVHCERYFGDVDAYTRDSLAHERAAKRQAKLIKAGRAHFW